MPQLLELPIECLDQVFSYLPVRSLSNRFYIFRTSDLHMIIVMYIWSSRRMKGDFVTLCLVSKAMRKAVIPLLYRNITIQDASASVASKGTDPDLQYWAAGTSALVQSLLAPNSRLVSSIRGLSLSYRQQSLEQQDFGEVGASTLCKVILCLEQDQLLSLE